MPKETLHCFAGALKKSKMYYWVLPLQVKVIFRLRFEFRVEMRSIFS